MAERTKGGTMVADASTANRLTEFRAALAGLEPAWCNWGKFEIWIAGVRPFVRRHFPEYMADFNEAGHKPQWLSLPRRLDCWAEHRADQALHQELATNNRLVEQTKSKLLAFLDMLTQLAAEAGNGWQKQRAAVDARRIFVIHGPDRRAYTELARFLASLKLEPRSTFEVGGAVGLNPHALRSLRRGMRQAAGVIALFTPEDSPMLATAADWTHASLVDASKTQARVTAIFGVGLALGIAARRTIVVTVGPDVGPLGAFRGIHTLTLDNGAESRNLLRQKLKAVGCAPDTQTVAHLDVASAGDFGAWLRPAEERVDAEMSGWTAP